MSGKSVDPGGRRTINETYIAAGMQGAVEKPVKPERLAVALDAGLPASEGRAAVA